MLAPYSNLDWRNYELTGTIVMPDGDVYVLSAPDGRDMKPTIKVKMKVLYFTVLDDAAHAISMSFAWVANMSGWDDLVTGSDVDTFTL